MSCCRVLNAAIIKSHTVRSFLNQERTVSSQLNVFTPDISQLSLPAELDAALAQTNPQAYGELLWQSLENIGYHLPNANSHLQICSDDPKIQHLAWETLAHPQHGYLAHSLNLNISRALPKTATTFKPARNSPVQILLFNTQVKQRLGLEQEQQALQHLFAAYPATVRFVVNYDGRFSKFCELLQQQTWDLVIFSGHALAATSPCLLFESEHQPFEAVSTTQLQNLFKQASVQCLILAACQSAHASNSQPSLTQTLAASVPHVIGMRESILDRASQVFVENFCAEIVRGANIGDAVQQARLAMQHLLTQGVVWRDKYHRPCAVPNAMQWSFPVLYSDNPQTRLLEKSDLIIETTPPALFIGRRRELRELHALLAQQQVIILEGGAGMGKTALLQQLWRDLHSAQQQSFVLNNLQQISKLTEIKKKVLCVIEAEHCVDSVDKLWAALNTLHNPELSLMISTRNHKKINAEFFPCYRLTAPSFEDFVSYGESLGLYYSTVQYRLLYQTTGGNFNLFKLLQTQTLPTDRASFLKQLAVVRRYLQALQRDS